jgi:hypothetical protein
MPEGKSVNIDIVTFCCMKYGVRKNMVQISLHCAIHFLWKNHGNTVVYEGDMTGTIKCTSILFFSSCLTFSLP